LSTTFLKFKLRVKRKTSLTNLFGGYYRHFIIQKKLCSAILFVPKKFVVAISRVTVYQYGHQSSTENPNTVVYHTELNN
jgi:type IV secretory pathway TrbD component